VVRTAILIAALWLMAVVEHLQSWNVLIGTGVWLVIVAIRVLAEDRFQLTPASLFTGGTLGQWCVAAMLVQACLDSAVPLLGDALVLLGAAILITVELRGRVPYAKARYRERPHRDNDRAVGG
jgi:hypothetical protein